MQSLSENPDIVTSQTDYSLSQVRIIEVKP